MDRQYEEGTVEDRSFGKLVGDLSSEAATLVRKEVDLARAEMAQKGREARDGAALLGAAAAIGLAALGALTAFLIIVLDLGMPTWAAALIVTVLMAVVAGALAMAGRNALRRAAPAVPEQTVETLKEDVEWAKTQMPSARRSTRAGGG